MAEEKLNSLDPLVANLPQCNGSPPHSLFTVHTGSTVKHYYTELYEIYTLFFIYNIPMFIIQTHNMSIAVSQG